MFWLGVTIVKPNECYECNLTSTAVGLYILRFHFETAIFFVAIFAI